MMAANIVHLADWAPDPWHPAPTPEEVAAIEHTLSCMLIAHPDLREGIWQHVQSVAVEDWPMPWQVVVGAMGKIAAADGPRTIDLLAVVHEIDERGNPEGVDAGFVSEIHGRAEVTYNAGYYARILSEAVRRRKVKARVRSIMSDLDNSVDTDEVLNRLTAAVEHSSPPRGDLEFASAGDWLITDGPEIDFIFAGNLPRGIVGMLSATGGSGKTYWALMIALLGAVGKPAFPFLRPQAPLRSILLLGEDAEPQIRKRTKAIADNFGFTAEERQSAMENLRIVCGMAEPLMTVGPYGGAMMPTARLSWLRTAIKKQRADLVVIDPLSRWGGLPKENDNSPAAQAIAILQNLATECGCTILMLHHSKKLGSTKEPQAYRGASALQDGARWAAELQRISPDDAKRFNIENPHEFIQFIPTKNSYAELSGAPVYLKRAANGVLQQSDPRRDTMKEIATAIGQWMHANNDSTLTEDELRCRPRCKALRDGLKAVFPGTRRDDYVRALGIGAGQGIFTTHTEQRGIKPTTVYSVAEPPEEAPF